MQKLSMNCYLIDNKIKSNSQHIRCYLPDNVKETLAQLVTRRIGELGTTKAAVAKKVGVSRSYIGNIANQTAPTQSGQYNLSPETVGSLAKTLEINESEILEAMDYLPPQLNNNVAIPNDLRDVNFYVFSKKGIERLKYQIKLLMLDETNIIADENSKDSATKLVESVNTPSYKIISKDRVEKQFGAISRRDEKKAAK